MKKSLLLLLLLSVFVGRQGTLQAADNGRWKAYPAYGHITKIEPAGNIIYVVSSNDLFSYNTNDQSIQTYDKARNLNDTEIELIKWCPAAQRLIVVYSNANIDLIDAKDNVLNMSDYYNKTIIGDKTINHIYINGHYAYISTGFGILKFNVRDNEISDTYNLGFNVNYSYIEQGHIYAASAQKGLYAASLSANLLDKSNWSRVGDYKKINEDNTTVRDNTNNCWWTVQDEQFLTAYRVDADNNKTTIVANVRPDGPKYNYFHDLKIRNNILYTAGGLFGFDETYRPGTIQALSDDGQWTVFQDDIATITGHQYLDINCVDVDPRNPQRVFACGRTGMYEFTNGKFTAEYSCDNSPLQAAFNNDKNYVILNSLVFDADGNLWTTNSISPSTSLFCLTAGGEWINHHKQQLMMDQTTSMENMMGMMFDSRGILWFVNNYHRKTALISYHPATDEVHVYERFYNQDGSPVTIQRVRCVTEDAEGNIWVGTDAGPLMLEPSQIGSDNPTFTQVKVPRNDGTNYADYLLASVDIRAITVDAANRKWFGTDGNGVYLVSSDNINEVHHFTRANSPLLSDYIEAIAVNHNSGSVYFATTQGLCSFAGDATATADEMTSDNVYAYPNPVRPDYQGPITIVGLSYNADIKITTVNGTLVASGRSNGGSFTWDGTDGKGKRVASGIYMVHTATQDGKKGTVCKIAIVN